MSKEIKKCKFGELDDVIWDIKRAPSILQYEVEIVDDLEDREFYRTVYVDGIRIIVSGLKLSIREGYVCIYSFSRRKEEDDYDLASVTLIYDETEEDPEDYSYVAADDEPREVVIKEYLKSKGTIIEDLNNLDCIVEIDSET